MEKFRVAQIYCPATVTNQGGRVGSGYLVNEDLVLTALHVIVGNSKAYPSTTGCEILLLSDAVKGRDWRLADLVWPTPTDWEACSHLDVAVLRLAIAVGPTDTLPQPTPLDWSGAAGYSIRCKAAGFPEGSVYGRDSREVRLMSGETNSFSGEVQGILLIGLASDAAIAPSERFADAKSWEGFSGAALFDGTRLIGIMIAAELKNRTLKARRIERLMEVQSFRNLVGLEAAKTPDFGSFDPCMGRRKQFGRLLPYLCDRRTQRRRFGDAVMAELERGRPRPQFLFVLGEDSQCADMFVEQLYSIDLPDLLRRNNLSGIVDQKLLRWPSQVSPKSDTFEINEHLEDLEREVVEKLGLSVRAGFRGIEAWLGRQSGTTFFSFDLDLRAWHEGHRRLLVAWMKWWEQLRASDRRFPLLVAGRFCYATKRRWWFGELSSTERMIGDLASVAEGVGENISAIVLPELGSVGYDDIDFWLHENAEFAVEAPPDLRRRLRQFFAGTLGLGERQVPMSEASAFLIEIMREMKISNERCLVGRSAS